MTALWRSGCSQPRAAAPRRAPGAGNLALQFFFACGAFCCVDLVDIAVHGAFRGARLDDHGAGAVGAAVGGGEVVGGAWGLGGRRAAGCARDERGTPGGGGGGSISRVSYEMRGRRRGCGRSERGPPRQDARAGCSTLPAMHATWRPSTAGDAPCGRRLQCGPVAGDTCARARACGAVDDTLPPRGARAAVRLTRSEGDHRPADGGLRVGSVQGGVELAQEGGILSGPNDERRLAQLNDVAAAGRVAGRQLHRVVAAAQGRGCGARRGEGQQRERGERKAPGGGEVRHPGQGAGWAGAWCGCVWDPVALETLGINSSRSSKAFRGREC